MDALNFHHLRYFWAVAHDGNLTRTAQRLNLSQSALSIQIKQLEERLGQRLFTRQGRQLQLTEAGRIALDHADAIFAVGKDLLGTFSAIGADKKVLRVGALATLSRNFQLRFLQPVLGRADVEITLTSGGQAELLRALAALNLDVVLLNQPPPPGAGLPLVAHRLAEQPASLVGLPKRIGRVRALAELLKRHPIILPSTDSSLRAGFDALTHRLGIKPKIAAEVDDMAMLRLLAREDVGLAVLPPIVVRDELAAGLLVEASRLPQIKETFFAVTVERRFPNPMLREVLRSKGLGIKTS